MKKLNPPPSALLLASLLVGLCSCLFSLQFASACLMMRHLDSKERPYVVRNFDFPVGGEDGYGLTILSPSNVLRRSVPMKKEDLPLTWRSLYGGFSISLIGPGFPQDAYNEEGLAVQVAVLRYQNFVSNPDVSLPAITDLEFAQLLVDQAKSVKEVLALLKDPTTGRDRVRLTQLSNTPWSKGERNLQWAVCDARGDCAEISYIHGTFRIEEFPIYTHFVKPFVVSNNPNVTLREHFERVSHVEDLPFKMGNQEALFEDPIPRSINAWYLESHFWEMNAKLDPLDPNAEPNQLFELLNRSTWTPSNKYQTVFDLQNKILYYRSKKSLNVKRFEFEKWERAFRPAEEVSVDWLHRDASLRDALGFRPLSKPSVWEEVLEAARNILTLIDDKKELADFVAFHIHLNLLQTLRPEPSFEDFAPHPTLNTAEDRAGRMSIDFKVLGH